jgi:hypothetical protein
MNTRSNRSTSHGVQRTASTSQSVEDTSTSTGQDAATDQIDQGTDAGDTTTQSPDGRTGGVARNNTSTTPGRSMSPRPMTVHSVPQLTFHENGEKLFMDDKHIDATHPNHVNITDTSWEFTSTISSTLGDMARGFHHISTVL